jgi:hypothetical protein
MTADLDIPDHIAGIIRICLRKRIGLFQAVDIVCRMLPIMWLDMTSVEPQSEALH